MKFLIFIIIFTACTTISKKEAIPYKYESKIGNYKNTFLNGFICTEKDFHVHYNKNKSLYTDKTMIEEKACLRKSTNKLFIKNHTKNILVLSLETSFFNGHMCSLDDVQFKFKDNKYHAQLNEMQSQDPRDFCHLEVEIKENKLFLNVGKQNPFACQVFCGARGSLNNTVFEFKK